LFGTTAEFSQQVSGAAMKNDFIETDAWLQEASNAGANAGMC
jgi:hypothetical protein